MRVSDKKRQPTAASQKAVAEVLAGGDFYTVEDQEEWKDDPAFDLTIKAFAWPMHLQAAGLAPYGMKLLVRTLEIRTLAQESFQGTSGI